MLLHASSVFNANECALDWFPNRGNVRQYVDLLVDVTVVELPDLVSDEYEPGGQYSASFMSLHKNKVADLKHDGRREPNCALDWWRSVENSSVVDSRKRRLSLSPLSLDAAGAFLSIQASPASAEPLFGDAGYQEGACRQVTGSSVIEICFTRAQLRF